MKAGEIRSYGRAGSVTHLSLPVAASKVFVKKKTLLIGWCLARVRLLDGGPLRFFKSMGVGHTRPLYPSTVDRGDLSFRCGLPGHKALQCATDKLHCASCVDAGRPAEHYMGGAKCRLPPVRMMDCSQCRQGPHRGLRKRGW